MANENRMRGPRMDWLDRIPNGELVDLFSKEFFNENRRMKSAFKVGTYRVRSSVAISMVQWWASFGVVIRLHEIRPDVWGEGDRGP